jgi:hypothetical protein
MKREGNEHVTHRVQHLQEVRFETSRDLCRNHGKFSVTAGVLVGGECKVMPPTG